MSGMNQQSQNRQASAVSESGNISRKCDQITLSSASENYDQASILKLKSKITQEIQTATTTGTIAALHDQIEAGEYRINPSAIAHKLLLLGDK